MDISKIALRVVAVVVALRALTNLGKPFGAGTGLVFFGKLLEGTPNTVLAPLLGVYMLAYAFGIWSLRRWALPMGIAYAVLVVVNMVVFPVLQSMPPNVTWPMYIVFAVIGLGGALIAPLLLARRSDLVAS